MLWAGDSHRGKMTHCHGLVNHMGHADQLTWADDSHGHADPLLWAGNSHRGKMTHCHGLVIHIGVR